LTGMRGSGHPRGAPLDPRRVPGFWSGGDERTRAPFAVGARSSVGARVRVAWAGLLVAPGGRRGRGLPAAGLAVAPLLRRGRVAALLGVAALLAVALLRVLLAVALLGVLPVGLLAVLLVAVAALAEVRPTRTGLGAGGTEVARVTEGEDREEDDRQEDQ